MANALNTWHQVEAPAIVPYSYGLFSVADPRPITDAHWRLGVEWQSQACLETGLTTSDCFDEVDPLEPPDESCVIRRFEPFTVYSMNRDEIPGRTLAEREDDTVARLLAGEQRSAEQQLWQMLGAEAGGTTDLTGSSAHYALAWLEQELAENYGGTGVIHMNRATAMTLYDSFRVQGGRLFTPLGTPVIAGGGYDEQGGSAPSSSILFGTGPVVIYRGDVDLRQQAIDRASNTVSFVAQRDYVIGWDCVVIGADLTIDPSSNAESNEE